MKAINVILTATSIALAALALPATAAQMLLNGNLESFSSGQPNSWTYRESPDRSLQTVESSVQVSPFTSVYASSTRSALLTDTTLSNTRPILTQLFSPQTTQLDFSFDFYVADSTFNNDPWVVSLKNDEFGLPFGGNDAFRLMIDLPGGVFRAQGQNSNFDTTILPNTWYHVQTTVNIAAAVFSGSIQPFGGSAVSWSADDLYNIFTTSTDPTISRVWVEDLNLTFGAANSNTHFDNFSVTAIPEPSTTFFGVVALAGILIRRFRSNSNG